MKMNDVFEADAAAFSVDDNSIEGIAAMAKRAKELSAEIKDLETVLKERQDQFRKLTETTLPEALASLGMKSFKMHDGSSIEIKPYYGASIPEGRRTEAHDWLRQHGFDDIIKNIVSVRFGRGEDELCARLIRMLRETGYPLEQAEKVEPMTLKAWVREQVERGNTFPVDLFGAYIGQKAIIKT